jgi:hypothetical protein
VNSQKPVIFEAKANAGVMQDKRTPRRLSSVSGEPLSARGVAFQRQEHKIDMTPALERPKHHGSQTRQLIPVTGCVPPFIAEQLERMRDQGGREKLSRSAVIADILIKGVQRSVDMQYGATLEPIIERTIARKIQSYSNRTANLAREAFSAAEEGRILSIYILRFMLGEDIEILPEIIKQSQEQAREHLKGYTEAKERQDAHN